LSEPFDPKGHAIVLTARLTGPRGAVHAALALDTGATTTFINTELLVAVGYDPSQADSHVFITTAAGIQYVPKVVVARIEALGRRCEGLAVVAGSLPPSAGVDGLLGLDFLRGKRLAIDFRKGAITLS
jgi:predicted aspartyl protease